MFFPVRYMPFLCFQDPSIQAPTPLLFLFSFVGPFGHNADPPSFFLFEQGFPTLPDANFFTNDPPVPPCFSEFNIYPPLVFLDLDGLGNFSPAGFFRSSFASYGLIQPSVFPLNIFLVLLASSRRALSVFRPSLFFPLAVPRSSPAVNVDPPFW